ncbi:hypothetical protein [Blastopirellula retiformator]|uniref:Uncharacterized protein n=1 Tax=Blastopirellula retiformator TaxID=2527970 RepID=A0A5C5V5P8_9BACT|nr:hypothetical protein [Blastopirellula retiformator]TWT33072.1 hypothetical protein Enr8_28920 [Blastopirellula retiformator]
MESWHVVLAAILLFLLVIAAFSWLIDVTGSWEPARSEIDWRTIQVPPMRIKLQPNPGIRWLDADFVERVQEYLQLNRFHPLGDFSSEEMRTVSPDFRVEAFWQPQHCVLAELQQTSAKELFVEFTSVGEAEQTYAVVVSSPFQLDLSPKFNVRLLSKDELYESLEVFYQNRPTDRPFQSLDAPRYVELFQRFYAEGIDWRIERGGLTADELARVVAFEGGTYSDELLSAVNTAWRFKYSEFLSANLRASFRVEYFISDDEWNRIRYRLVFVHHKQLLWQVFQTWEPVYACVNNTGDNEAYARHCDSLRSGMDGKAPRQAFAELNEKLGQLRFKPYGQMSSPIAADVYVHPRGPDKAGNYLPA